MSRAKGRIEHRRTKTEPKPTRETLDTRLERARAALTAAGEPEPRNSINPIARTYELTQGTPALGVFWHETDRAGLTDLYYEGWPSDASEAGEDAAFSATSAGWSEAVYRLANGTVAYVSLDPREGMLSLTVASTGRDAAEETFSEFRSRYPLADLTSDASSARVNFWMFGPFGPQQIVRNLDVLPWDEIQENYTADVRGELGRMMSDFEPGKDGQLLLWHGFPGTGKTWALRALASEWRDWADFHYITDPDAFFGDHASYMVEVLLRESWDFSEDGEDPVGRWRVLILEDTGELLGADAKTKTGQALSRLLNVVDGLIGQGLRVLVLVTTNDQLGELHPAVSRPGRCAMELEFTALSPAEATAWLGEEVTEPTTVAELFGRRGAGEDPSLAAAANLKGGRTLSRTTDVISKDDVLEVKAVDLGAKPTDEEDDDEPDDEETAIESSTFVLTASDGRKVTFTVEPAVAPEDALSPRDERPARNETPAPDLPEQRTDGSYARWEAIFAPEGKLTDDGRMFWPGSISWRNLPLTLMAMVETADGHDGAQVSGRIDEIWRDGSLIRAAGVFDDSEYATDIARMVAERILTGLSVDIAARSFELVPKSVLYDEQGNLREDALNDDGEEVDLLDLLFGGPEEELVFVVTDGVIGAATVCPFPAFADAEIALAASGALWTATLPALFTVLKREGPDNGTGDEALTASAAGLAPLVPPAEWFANPELEELTAMTVSEDGRVYGHAAAWGTCHIGIPDACTTAPHSQTDYSYFHLGEVAVEGGDPVPVGKITLGKPHASKHLGWKAAAEHYDDTRCVVADIAVGEDEFGIWFSGALRPDIPAERVRELRAAVPSGDWRNVDGNLELVGVLAVNVPGFPVPRAPRALMAAGGDDGVQVLALVAAGIPRPETEAVLLTDGQKAKLAALAARADSGLLGLARLAEDV